MKHLYFFVALFMAVSVNVQAQKEQHVADYVSTLVGTDSNFELSTGNTYPVTAMPWGMNFWTPQCGKNGDGWTYSYTSNRIRGFKQTHQPSPWINDYGQFSIMPITGTPIFDEKERASFFNHKAEVARPYYYSVFLADYAITTELVPTERAAILRFTYPEAEQASVVIDAFDRGSGIKVDVAGRTVTGYTTRNSGGVTDNFRNYFVIQFDKPFTYSAAVLDGKINTDADIAEGDHAGAIIGFSTKAGEQVHARVASSFISPEQALQNLKELGNDSFDQLKEKGRQRWDEILGRIEVETGNTDQLRTFYSCLFRSCLFPRQFFEYTADGKVVHYSPHTGKVEPGRLFTDTGFWDSFRGELPFIDLVYPEMGEQMQEGFYNAYRESGFYPEWSSPGHRDCMVGNNSASVVVDAYMKGLVKNDPVKVYESLLTATNSQHPKVPSSGRAAFASYNKLGYVPSDEIGQSAARTLEYAYNDWCIYQMGKKLNRPKKEIEVFKKRSQNYRNIFYAKYGFMSGRDSNGTFPEKFNPCEWWGPFTEGNSWHWTWCVFHDIQGLIDLMGGKQQFVDKLDAVWTTPPVFGENVDTRKQLIHEMREMQVINMGQYAHGNQPIQHMPYLYNFAGQPWKSQYWVRQIMDRLYTPAPDGYCGDEDNGQTSAWYVMSALGFYSVCPGTNQYVVGSPLFPKAKIHFPGGKTMVIEALNNTQKDNVYIQDMKLNGAEYSRNYLLHSDLQAGGSITFRMGSQPNRQRGTAADDAPYSMSR